LGKPLDTLGRNDAVSKHGPPENAPRNWRMVAVVAGLAFSLGVIRQVWVHSEVGAATDASPATFRLLSLHLMSGNVADFEYFWTITFSYSLSEGSEGRSVHPPRILFLTD